MKAEIKQQEDEGPACDLCVINIKHGELYLSFDHECSAGEVSGVVICEECLFLHNQRIQSEHIKDSKKPVQNAGKRWTDESN